MSLTYGFYNSVSHDRKYNAEQLSSIFDGLITDGVYDTVGQCFLVRAYSGMTIYVGTGRAWFNHTWTLNDAIMPLTLEDSELVQYRIDAVVIEIDRTTAVRANSIKVIKGTPADTERECTPPTMAKTEFVHQYPLAYITVGPNIAEISDAVIENRVGTSDCPFVDGLLTRITTDQLIVQWRAQFEAWFDTLRDIMDENVATHLQNEIEAVDEQTKSFRATFPASGWVKDNSTNFYYQSVTVAGLDPAIDWVGPFHNTTGVQATDEALNEAVAMIGHFETTSNTVTAVCYDDKPSVNLTLFFLPNNIGHIG